MMSCKLLVATLLLLLSQQVAAGGCGFCAGGTLSNPGTAIALSSGEDATTCNSWQTIDSLTEDFSEKACSFMEPFFNAVCGCSNSVVNDQCDLCGSQDLIFEDPTKGLVIPGATDQKIICHTIWDGVQKGAVPYKDCQVLMGIKDYCGGCTDYDETLLDFLELPISRFDVPVQDPTLSPTMAPTMPPTEQPTEQPTMPPTEQPVFQPAFFPNLSVTGEPTVGAFVGSIASFPSGDGEIAESAIEEESSEAPSSSPSGSPTTLSPTGGPSAGPTVTLSSEPTVSSSEAPSDGPSMMHSSDPTFAPTTSPSEGPSATHSSTPSETLSAAPSDGPSITHSSEPSETASSGPSSVPTAAASADPTATPSSGPSVTLSAVPSDGPSIAASSEPSETASSGPSSVPTAVASADPTATHSSGPSVTLSAMPSDGPSIAASSEPSETASSGPTIAASSEPSEMASSGPTLTASAMPSDGPSVAHSSEPSETASSGPTLAASAMPSDGPSIAASSEPSVTASSGPTLTASAMPSDGPSIAQSSEPSVTASSGPTLTASAMPSDGPSIAQSSEPTSGSTSAQLAEAMVEASASPSEGPTMQLLVDTNVVTTTKPTASPTATESSAPTSTPSAAPSDGPSIAHSSEPTAQASESPTSTHSSGPTSTPSMQPSTSPSIAHSSAPSSTMSMQPSTGPSIAASSSPSSTPTAKPTNDPTGSPSSSPSVKSVLREAEIVASEELWTCDLCPPAGTLENPSRLISLLRMENETVTKTCGALLWDARTGRNDLDPNACTFLQPFFSAICGCSTFTPFPTTDKKEDEKHQYNKCKLCKKPDEVWQDPFKSIPIPGAKLTHITCGGIFSGSVNGAVTESECEALSTISGHCGGCGKENSTFYDYEPKAPEQCVDCSDESESSMYIYKDFGNTGTTFSKAFSAPLHCDAKKGKGKKQECKKLLYPELEGCVLAPITSFDELLRIQAVIPPGKAAYTAVRKDPLVLKTEAAECYSTDDYHGIKGFEVQFSRSRTSDRKNCVVENWMEGLSYGYDKDYESMTKSSPLQDLTPALDPCESMKSGWVNFKTGTDVPSTLWQKGKLNYCNLGPVQDVGAVWAVEPEGQNYGDLRDVSMNWPLPGAVYKCCKTIHTCFEDRK